MEIISAEYVDSTNGDHQFIKVSYDDPNNPTISFLPVNGQGWINQILNQWIAAGNTISPAAV